MPGIIEAKDIPAVLRIEEAARITAESRAAAAESQRLAGLSETAAAGSAGAASGSAGAAAGSAGQADTRAAAADQARGNAAAAAAQANAVLLAMQVQRYGAVIITDAASLTLAAHANRLLQVAGSGSITVPWSTTGAGFSCLILNQRSISLPIAVTGAALSHPDGHTRVRVGGLAALIATDGAPGVLQLIGQTEP